MNTEEKDVREILAEHLNGGRNYCIVVSINQDNPTHGILLKLCENRKDLDNYIYEWNDKVRNKEVPENFKPQLILTEHEPLGLIAPKTYNVKTDSLMSEKGKAKIKEITDNMQTEMFVNTINTDNNP